MPRSLLSPTSAARIRALSLRGFETKKQLQGVVWLSFSRWSNEENGGEGGWITLPPQSFVLEFAERDWRDDASDSAVITRADGYLYSDAVKDIEVDDRFSVGEPGSRQSGKVSVVYREDLGVLRAGFLLQVGEV